MRLTVVGNPANRRVGLFTRAARAAGLPEPAVLPWRDVLTGAAAAPGPDALVRVESPGEDAEVDRLLRGATTPARHGELAGTAAAYRGLVRGVGRVASGGALLLSRPGDIAVLCDKRRCHAVLAAAGVPVPGALPPVGGYAELRAAMAARRWARVFVKPAHGSSAAGVLAFAVGPGRVQAVTTVAVTTAGLFNALRPRRYTDEAVIADIVDRLAPDGLHVERWLPKAGLHGRTVDVRVVVTAGRPLHAVVRAARGPITNLHLGNARGDLAALRAAAGQQSWDAAMHTCRRVAACFPGTLHVGVDLMFRAGWRRHAVAEVNAFGDLLPGVVDHAGRDTYTAQLAALADGWTPRPAARHPRTAHPPGSAGHPDDPDRPRSAPPPDSTRRPGGANRPDHPRCAPHADARRSVGADSVNFAGSVDRPGGGRHLPPAPRPTAGGAACAR